MNRRQFVKSATLGAVPLGVATDGIAQETPAKPNDPAVLGQALLDFAKNRFGQHLSEEQVKFLQTRILRNLANAALLRATPLTNGDEPDFIFAAD